MFRQPKVVSWRRKGRKRSGTSFFQTEKKKKRSLLNLLPSWHDLQVSFQLCSPMTMICYWLQTHEGTGAKGNRNAITPQNEVQTPPRLEREDGPDLLRFRLTDYRRTREDSAVGLLQFAPTAASSKPQLQHSQETRMSLRKPWFIVILRSQAEPS